MEPKVWADIPFSPSKLNLLEVKYLKGNMESPEDLFTENIVDFNSDCSMSVGFNIEQNMLRANFSAALSSNYADEIETGATAYFELSFIFSYEKLSEMLDFDNDGIVLKIHPNLFNAISSISYSTSRGLLISRLQGTSFSDFILPIIDPNELPHNV
ncbi:hypothetical protein EGI22_16125 [Lacihabitans sp. LS3-19]|uniref:hypothetical protein n=1 Tax=Lacihabitans sp. LS3-19 TaxID=2487335 RepID=UPI0020CD247B|nr:hypothetical protein [Lacihabitans sp. LS3-19]MCP9769431.1 hypothetical protein [Lacihabitans sp. LS3-19]